MTDKTNKGSNMTTHASLAKAIIARFDRGDQVLDTHAKMIKDARLARKHKITVRFSPGLLNKLQNYPARIKNLFTCQTPMV